ncbi:tRNA (adenosine(37)-N6)-threonylcarbamoyltransferase complex ATPase subunit type 1 TsaE [Patescibacteria group bacterium]|nr:tRNA (adenosine(37)-N6)-threonylcarbamoyltransferase complex ATPase subunit type 1 TsaE [Patescibacteria group bacterium]
MKKVTHSATETKKLAIELAKNFKGGELLGLEGDLGSGKTVFVQGLAKGLGIKEKVNSPTFVLMKIYQLPKAVKQITQLVHVDAYRLQGAQEFKDIGLDEYTDKKNTLVVIEWIDKVAKVKSWAKYKQISFNFGEKPNNRTILIK